MSSRASRSRFRGVGTLMLLLLLAVVLPGKSRAAASLSAGLRTWWNGGSVGRVARAVLAPREFAPYLASTRGEAAGDAWSGVNDHALQPPPADSISPHEAALIRAVDEGWVTCGDKPRSRDGCQTAFKKASVSLAPDMAVEAAVLRDPDGLRVKAAVAAAESAGLKRAGDAQVHAPFLSSEDRAQVEDVERVLGLATLWGLGWPLPPGTRITSPYGERIHPVTGARTVHEGVDLAAETGTPLLAPSAARVLHVGEDGVSGTYVVLDHGHGVQSVSCHLSEALLKRGGDAAAGATYARTGASGRVTGPHLHYGVRVGGRFVDPVAASRRAPPPPKPAVNGK